MLSRTRNFCVQPALHGHMLCNQVCAKLPASDFDNERGRLKRKKSLRVNDLAASIHVNCEVLAVLFVPSGEQI